MADTAVHRANHPVDIDHEMIALSMQMEELGLFVQQSKGKHPIGSPPDLEVAFQSFQTDLVDYKVFLEDQKMAHSIGAAVHTDGTMISTLTSRDIQLLEDRRAALNLCERDPQLEKATETEVASPGLEEYISTVAESVAAASVIYEDSDDDAVNAGPSISFREKQADALERLKKTYVCGVCSRRVHATSIIGSGCGHRYCVSCAKTLFLMATKDETRFPPRCCKKDIPRDDVLARMSPEERNAFETASVEFETMNRVYCSNRQCSVFLRPDTVDAATKTAICARCSQSTCVICKNETHAKGMCPEDTELLETQSLARAMGWQTCYKCGRLVDLRTGCFHMTCRCKAEFCYVCGTEWKKCHCTNADVNRMLERAEEVVDRDPDVPVHHRQQRVREVHERLLENHECVHPGKFQRIFGNGGRRSFRCEFCETRHWNYILECRHCSVRVCEDCRRYRT